MRRILMHIGPFKTNFKTPLAGHGSNGTWRFDAHRVLYTSTPPSVPRQGAASLTCSTKSAEVVPVPVHELPELGTAAAINFK